MNKRWLPLLVLVVACSDRGEPASAPEAVYAPLPAPKKNEEARQDLRNQLGGDGTLERDGRPTDQPTTTEPTTTEPTTGERADRTDRADRPAVDFGGRVFLSNDDSSSLASAQRVLWSVAQGQPVRAAELRPHELLNYFTFEPPTLGRGDTFGVAASAVRTEDGLALALTVTGARPERRPLDLTVLLDRSGSMEGERMELVRRGLLRMVDRLRPGDRVNVVVFDDVAVIAREGFEVGRDDPDDLRLLFEEIRPRGGTDLDQGLEAAYRVVRRHDLEGRDARVLVVTDAKLTAGDVNADRITEIGRAFDESHVRLAGIGVGDDFDDHVLQQLTEKGRGAYVYLGSEKVVDRVFGSGFDALVNVVADDVRFSLDLPDSLGVARFYGEEMSRVAADVQPVSFYAGTTQVFLQDLQVAPGGYTAADPLVLDLSWRDPRTGRERSQRWTGTVGAALDGDRSNVTKARALMAWTDLVRAGRDDCATERAAWDARVAAFGGDLETRYLDGLVAGWCPHRGGVIAEAE